MWSLVTWRHLFDREREYLALISNFLVFSFFYFFTSVGHVFNWRLLSRGILKNSLWWQLFYLWKKQIWQYAWIYADRLNSIFFIIFLFLRFLFHNKIPLEKYQKKFLFQNWWKYFRKKGDRKFNLSFFFLSSEKYSSIYSRAGSGTNQPHPQWTSPRLVSNLPAGGETCVLRR